MSGAEESAVEESASKESAAKGGSGDGRSDRMKSAEGSGYPGGLLPGEPAMSMSGAAKTERQIRIMQLIIVVRNFFM